MTRIHKHLDLKAALLLLSIDVQIFLYIFCYVRIIAFDKNILLILLYVCIMYLTFNYTSRDNRITFLMQLTNALIHSISIMSGYIPSMISFRASFGASAGLIAVAKWVNLISAR